MSHPTVGLPAEETTDASSRGASFDARPPQARLANLVRTRFTPCTMLLIILCTRDAVCLGWLTSRARKVGCLVAMLVNNAIDASADRCTLGNLLICCLVARDIASRTREWEKVSF